jgi:hypothetical protein
LKKSCYFFDMESPTEKANRLFLEGRCVFCGDPAPKPRFGLCQKHYQRYYRLTKSLSVEAKAVFDAESIAAGELIPNRQGKREKEQTSFEARLERLKQSGIIQPATEIPNATPADDDLPPAEVDIGRPVKKKAALPAAKNVAKPNASRKKAQ